MPSSSWLLVAVAALATTGVQAHSAAFAAFAASTSQCSSVTTCYEGGAESTPCTVSSGGCPPCVTFADDGCYVKVDGACPFGVDCSSMWTGSSTSSGSSTSTTSTSSSTGTSSSTTTTSSTSTDSTTSTTAGTSSKSASGTSGTAGVSSSSSTTASSTSGSSSTTAGDSSSGGSDMSVVFAIIGAAIGVIAVAVIFLTLVRRSKAAHEDDDDDDMANTPPAFSKNPVVQAPHSTTGAAMYASYNGSNRAPGMGSGGAGEIGLDASKGVSMNAVSYYNQQPPHNSAAPSPRVAGRAIPSQPVGMNQSTGMGRPYGSSQNFGQMSQLGSSGVGVMSHAPPTPVQHPPTGGVAPSPHNRRESYEF